MYPRFRPSLRSVSGEQARQQPGEQVAEEEKRRSTGSISNLVRIWEADSGQPPEEGAAATSRPASVVKFEKRVWPPVRGGSADVYYYRRIAGVGKCHVGVRGVYRFRSEIQNLKFRLSFKLFLVVNFLCTVF